MQALFFQSFRTDASTVITFAVNAKVLMALFRNATNMQSIAFQFDEAEGCLWFTIECKMGIRKCCRVNTVEKQDFKAVYSTDDCAYFSCPAKLLLGCLSNFHQHVLEVSLSANRSSLTIESHEGLLTEEMRYKKRRRPKVSRYGLEEDKGMATQMMLDAQDFDQFDVAEPIHGLAFTIKEFKSFLTFVDQTCLRATVFLPSVGKPVVMSAVVANVLRGDFIFATLSDDDDHADGATQSSQNTTTTQTKQTAATSSSSSSSSSSSTTTTTRMRTATNNATPSSAPSSGMSSANVTPMSQRKRHRDDITQPSSEMADDDQPPHQSISLSGVQSYPTSQMSDDGAPTQQSLSSSAPSSVPSKKQKTTTPTNNGSISQSGKSSMPLFVNLVTAKHSQTTSSPT
mmetsp:Transcript_12785/g.19359  ORF Transcript_12785/g.19359 Transcript_12785/m.19359 type:complete len:399 (+) Transcript_12785:89-1285(+)